MDKELISVIVPVYKVEEYLDECIESIVKQTYTNLEIILVDDGSPDSCGKICDFWAEKDSRISVIHKNNGGLSDARNAGLEMASGEYIGFVDSDDYIAVNMYEILYKAIKESGKQIAICYPYFVKENGEILVPDKITAQGVLGSEEVLSLIFAGEIEQSVWSRLFHRSIFEKISFPVGETNEDIPLAIPMFLQSGGAINTGSVLYYYRSRANSVTHSYWNTDAGIVLKHLHEIEYQIAEYGLTKCKSIFRLFMAKSAYSTALHLDKNYGRIGEQAKGNLKKYIAIMRENLVQYLLSSRINIKDKMLYIMIVTRILRPVYMILGKELN